MLDLPTFINLMFVADVGKYTINVDPMECRIHVYST